MIDPPTGAARASLSLPDRPSLEWLRKRAKQELAGLRTADPSARLADAQLRVARAYGFTSWRALRAHVTDASLEGSLFRAARAGHVPELTRLLDTHPDLLFIRDPPYQHTLLHVAAADGQLAAVDLLLGRGIDPNVRERGDNTYPMHWAAAGGHLDVVRRLADAGGDVVGRGDDHALEVIGWATCWERCHGDVAEFLVSRGAKHTIFSAVAMNLEDEVRRLVAERPAELNRRLTRNDDHRLPIHLAVMRKRPEMVRLLVELGADPLAVDGSGVSAVTYATSRGIDGPIMEAIRSLLLLELDSATRGERRATARGIDLVALLALRDLEIAERLVRDVPALLDPAHRAGVLHVMAKRGDVEAVEWLLAHGADPNARWDHWDAEVTPLHLAAAQGHEEVVRVLLAAGGDPTLRDSKHDSDPAGWAGYFGHPSIASVLAGAASGR